MSPKARRRVRVLIGGATLVAGLVGAWWQLFGIANRRLNDVDFLEHATEEEAARTAERVLWFPIGNHHDACLMLDAVGDVRAVPALLQALRYNPPQEGGMVCTTLHCFDALRAVTGYDGDAVERTSDRNPIERRIRGRATWRRGVP
jgi:hypothetical protein